MKPKTFMLIAGEASGDLLGAELVQALRQRFTERQPVSTTDQLPLHATLAPRFFGAGGARMAAMGVDLAFDLTEHSVIGYEGVLRKYFEFRRLFKRLVRLACERQPDVIVCVDFSGFNRRFARAIRQRTRGRNGWFHAWQPRIRADVSPQVWASRPGRVHQIAQDYDLVLAIFPFEKQWYALRAPRLPVEFVGHPIMDRYRARATATDPRLQSTPNPSKLIEERLSVLLLPGSRPAEIERHLPVMKGALAMMRTVLPNLAARMVLPNATLLEQAKSQNLPAHLELQVGGLAEALEDSTVAIASTGTVTVECAYFGVPTVAIYKTSLVEFQIGKQIVTVRHLAMPNLLANEEIYPELIQYMATSGNIARAALDLLRNEDRRRKIKGRLQQITCTLGEPGASRRAADAIFRLQPSLLS